MERASIWLLLLAALAAQAVFAEGSKEAAGPRDLVEVKVEIFDRGNAPQGEGTVMDNRWTKWINERMAQRGVKVTSFPIPRTEEVTKLNVLFASGEAPDLSYTFNRNQYHVWAESGALTELSDVVKKHGANIEKYWKDRPGVRELSLNRGKMFSVLSSRYSPFAEVLLMRKDWVDRLGMKIPTTLDEFYGVLKAFKVRDPGGVGRENVIPFSGQAGVGMFVVSPVMSAYGAAGHDYEYIDGRVWPMTITPRFRDVVIFFNKLYKEGLMDKEFIGVNSIPKKNALVMTGRVGAYKDQMNYMDYTNVGQVKLNHDMVEKFPDALWVAVDGFPDRNGRKHVMARKSYWYYSMVPSFSKRAAEVIKYLDWQAEEGGEVLRHGLEGEHYTIKEGFKVPKDLAYSQKTKDWIQTDIMIMPPIEDAAIIKVIDPIRKFADNSLRNYEWIITTPTTPVIFFDRSLPTLVKHSATLNKLRDTKVVQAIVSDDPGRLYDEYLAEYMKNGGQEFIEKMTAAYKAMMGIK